jgi:hypothetical protein
MQTLIGFAVTPQSLTDCAEINQALQKYQSNVLRLAFSGLTQYINGSRTYKKEYVDYFLQNFKGYIILDLLHIYPPNTTISNVFKTHIEDAKTEIYEKTFPFANNKKILVELINEYDNTDFYDITGQIADYLKSKGINNIMGANLPPHNRQIITTALKMNYQGYHHYFDYTNYNAAISFQHDLINTGNMIINTEVGASTKEATYTTTQIQQFNQYLTDCYKMGIGNCVWLNYWNKRKNLNAYETAGLIMPKSQVIEVEKLINYGEIPGNWSGVEGIFKIENQNTIVFEKGILGKSSNITEANNLWLPANSPLSKGQLLNPGDRIYITGWSMSEKPNIDLEYGTIIGFDYYSENARLGEIISNWAPWGSNWTFHKLDTIVPSTFEGGTPLGFIPFCGANWRKKIDGSYLPQNTLNPATHKIYGIQIFVNPSNIPEPFPNPSTVTPIPTPTPTKTVWARTPSIGNSKLTQYYMRKIRDSLITKEMHKKLHPLV